MGSSSFITVVRDPNLIKKILFRRWPMNKEIDTVLVSKVKDIIDDVRNRGNEALIDLTQRFDNTVLDESRISVDPSDIEKAYQKIDEETISAIKFVKTRTEYFQKAILNHLTYLVKSEGLQIKGCFSPIRSVGCYVPGGLASYASSLVMSLVPAIVAGVPDVAICSPPSLEGEINPVILVAADICGVNRIYRVGGAQAIAALAYGTRSVTPVEKIVGPGNQYVQIAKTLISKDLPIDFPAGPTEIIILADKKADPNLIALDMISQAEHPNSIVALVTPSRILTEKVISEFKRLIPAIPNSKEVINNLRKTGFIIICKSIEEGINFVNSFAPEHLEILAEDGQRISKRILSSGLVLVGKNTPVAASDYCLGTIHILPTGGFSRVYSGLSVVDFVKRYNIVECSTVGLMKIRNPLRILAENEGLENHIMAVEGRFHNG